MGGDACVARVTRSSTIKCLTGIARRSITVTLNIKSTRDHLQTLDYKTLFIEDLGWSRPPLLKPITVPIHNTTYMLGEIAELAGVAVFEVRTTAANGKIPDANTRKAIHREISR